MLVRRFWVPMWLGVASAWATQAPAGAGADWVLPNFAQRLEVEVANRGSAPVKALVTIPVEEAARVAPNFPGSLAIAAVVNPPGSAFAVSVVPSQVDDLDGDGAPDQVEFPVALGPGEQREVDIYYSTTLHDSIAYQQKAHARHAYGYNRQTATLESELIGYRTYGGFFLDVEARTAGHPGLYNDLVGYLSASRNFEAGKDIFHIGDTLGLGGIFLRRDGRIYRPPLNMPDYAHKPQPPGTPHYRILADGPLRAAFEATLDPWKLGDDEVRIRATYSIDEDTEFVRCRFWISPLRMAPEHEYEVGTGIRDLPSEKLNPGRGRLMLSGEQTPKLGRFALALFFDPATAVAGDPIQTPESSNQAILFRQKLAPGRAVSGGYSVAAAWSRSGIPDLFPHLEALQPRVEAHIELRAERYRRTPRPDRVEGEAN